MDLTTKNWKVVWYTVWAKKEQMGNRGTEAKQRERKERGGLTYWHNIGADATDCDDATPQRPDKQLQSSAKLRSLCSRCYSRNLAKKVSLNCVLSFLFGSVVKPERPLRKGRCWLPRLMMAALLPEWRQFPPIFVAVRSRRETTYILFPDLWVAVRAQPSIGVGGMYSQQFS